MTTSTPWSSSAHVQASALIAGYPALLFSKLLRRTLDNVEQPSDRRAESLQALEVLEMAGEAYLARCQARSMREATSRIGSAEVPIGSAPPSWSEVMTTTEVAKVLGVSRRQVCNLAGELGGRQSGRGGTWAFPRAAVLAHLDGRLR